MIGNPVRSKLVATLLAGAGNDERGAAPGILVVGGSQGARAVNDLVLAAVEVLARNGSMPVIVHQTGSSDLDRCKERYRAMYVVDRVEVRPFIDDIATEYHRASLVVARAGALTLAELAIAGRPAILVPLPTAADDHQSKNAARFAKAGAAIVLNQHNATGAQLARLLGDLLADPGRHRAMSAAMRSLARPRAAAEIVDRLERLTEERT
jgi:UDP-N-acetylglucosamine--N-acetylmuramyl-(pentapeptide) pyrophosphoryl-undecaprenol N-acetylglucosamine transferase